MTGGPDNSFSACWPRRGWNSAAPQDPKKNVRAQDSELEVGCAFQVQTPLLPGVAAFSTGPAFPFMPEFHVGGITLCLHKCSNESRRKRFDVNLRSTKWRQLELLGTEWETKLRCLHSQAWTQGCLWKPQLWMTKGNGKSPGNSQIKARARAFPNWVCGLVPACGHRWRFRSPPLQ